MEDDLTKVLSFMYNPIEDLTVINVKGTSKRKACIVRGQFKSFEELPDTIKESVKRLYEEANVDAFRSLAGISQIDHLNMVSNASLIERSNLGAAVVELNIENATLLKYIKELYGEFIENDLSTEDTLNAKQLMIKEWLDEN